MSAIEVREFTEEGDIEGKTITYTGRIVSLEEGTKRYWNQYDHEENNRDCLHLTFQLETELFPSKEKLEFPNTEISQIERDVLLRSQVKYRKTKKTIPNKMAAPLLTFDYTIEITSGEYQGTKFEAKVSV